MRTYYVCALALAAALASATASAATPIAWPGYAVQLDGANDYVQSPNLRSAFSSDTVTLELWFNAAAAGVIVDESGGLYITNPGWHDSQIEILSTGEVRVRVWALASVSLGTVAFNTWHHVALRYNQTGQRLDGFLDGVASANSVVQDRQSPWDGGSLLYYSLGSADTTNLGSGAYFRGMVDEFRVWNVARTQAEIQAAMNRPLAGNEPGLVHYLRCDDGVLTTATDSSPNAWNATLLGGAAFVPYTVNAVVGQDTVITLLGWDADGDALAASIAGPPATGTLYQYDNGARGLPISAPGAVADSGMRVIYAPPGIAGTDSFTYTVNDGVNTSAVTRVNIAIKSNQTITFNPLLGKNEGDPAFVISATAAPSGLAITFSIISGPATVASTGPTTANVTLTGSGADVVVRAAQPGDANYFPAPNVEQTFHVNARPVAGLGGSALRFDGVDDFVSVPNFGTYAPTTEVTVEFWQKVSSVKQQETFALNPDNGNNRILAHVPWDNGTVYWDFGNSGAGGRLQYTPLGGGGILVNTWQHFALVASQSGNYMRIYRNGVLEASKVGMEPFDWSAANLQIGGIVGWSFGGDMDEFRIWNVARSPAEIQAAMNMSLTGAESGLLLYQRFDDGAGTASADSSPNGHPGTLQNGVRWVGSGAPINTLQAPRSTDKVITLLSFDAEGSALTTTVATIPPVGQGELYQYDSATGGRGAPIAALDGVTDAGKRVIYAAPAGVGTTTSFTYTASEGVLTSSAATVNIIVTKAPQTVTFAPVPPKVVGDPPFTVSATASSGLLVTISLVSGPATFDAATNTVTITGAGVITLQAEQGGDADYDPAPAVLLDVRIGLAQTIAFPAIPDHAVGDRFTLTATASSGLPVSFSIVSGPATLDRNIITLTGVGVVVVRASQAGEGFYNPAPDVDVSFTVYALPVITSGAAAMPNPGLAGHAVQLSCAATDVLAFTYTWAFGDGTSGSGATPMHTYAAPGTYVVKVTVTNSVGGSTSSTLNLVVGAAGGFVAGDTDSDGDGYYDEIETALGSSASDFGSRPLGLAALTTNGNLYAVKTNIVLNFAKTPGNDSIALMGVLHIPAGFNIAGQVVIVDVGGIVKSFTLDGKGASPKGNERFAVKVRAPKGVVPLHEAKFTLTLKKGTYAATLQSFGLVNDDVLKSVTVPETVIFNGEVLVKAAVLNYRGHKGRTGLAR